MLIGLDRIAMMVSRFLPRRLSWELYYVVGRTPWDTGEIPPELTELLAEGELRPERALDVGCGTGTHSIYMARHCPDVVGVDFSRPALRQARRKAERAGVSVRFQTADVLTLGAGGGTDLGGLFDFMLDLSCLHTFSAEDRARYGESARRVVRPGGHVLLYAWKPREQDGRTVGLSQEETQAVMGDAFQLKWVRDVAHTRRPRFCYLFERVSDGGSAT